MRTPAAGRGSSAVGVSGWRVASSGWTAPPTRTLTCSPSTTNIASSG
jgi:hypothetical protein